MTIEQIKDIDDSLFQCLVKTRVNDSICKKCKYHSEPSRAACKKKLWQDATKIFDFVGSVLTALGGFLHERED